MAKKVTQKSIKDMVKNGVAKDVSSMKHSDINESLTVIAYSKSPSSNASNGCLMVGDKTKKLYAAFGGAVSYWK